jgi:hypothetical protein
MFNPDFLNTIWTQADLNETRTNPKDVVCTASKSLSGVVALEFIDVHGESLDNFVD